MKRTQHDRLVEALQKKGFVILENQRTQKYTTMDHPDKVHYPSKFFIGKSGALRKGRTSSVSFSVNSIIKKTLLNEVPQ